jgi:uncharacterized protein (DUF169 family)
MSSSETSSLFAGRLQQLLSLTWAPVGIAFREQPPASVPRVSVAASAGCGYWKWAAEGQVFYTEAEDHYACPIGAHTHGVELPSAVADTLQGLVRSMAELRYLMPEEVAAIPRRRDSFRIAIYAPYDRMPCESDVVLIRGSVKQMMLLAEAAQSVGVSGGSPALGRPTCAVIPGLRARDAQSRVSVVSANRLYRGLEDSEGYCAVPGAVLPDVVERLAVMVEANRQLEKFHRDRAAARTEGGMYG